MKNAKKSFLIRVDASEEIGSGHLMRMVALAELLSDSGNKVHFLTIEYSKKILEVIRKEAYQINLIDGPFSEDRDSVAIVDLAKKINANWIVLDGYHFSSKYEKIIKEKVSEVKLMRFEDTPIRHHFADVLVSQNFSSNNMKFSTEPYTKLLLGLEFLILRREFRKGNIRPKIKSNKYPKKILITLGGGTPEADEAGLKILEALSNVESRDLEISFVAGKFSKGTNIFKHTLKPGHTFLEHCDDMAYQMTNTDIALVSGGSSMWELMSIGVPFLAIALNSIQESYLKMMCEKGLCSYLGHYLHLDPLILKKSILQFRDNVSLQSEYRQSYAKLINNENQGVKLLNVLFSQMI